MNPMITIPTVLEVPVIRFSLMAGSPPSSPSLMEPLGSSSPLLLAGGRIAVLIPIEGSYKPLGSSGLCLRGEVDGFRCVAGP